MDTRHSMHCFVAKNCARTNGSDTIDGAAVTGAQIWSPKDDTGALATSYYGAGELVITDTSGKVLSATTALKSVGDIVINLRSKDGTTTYASQAINGASITGYHSKLYTAPQNQVQIIHTLPDVATTENFTYTITFSLRNSYVNQPNAALTRSAMYTVTSAETELEVLTGLAANINANFNNDTIMPLKATVDATNKALVIEALDLDWQLPNFTYQKLQLNVFINFNATSISNLGSAIVADAAYTGTYPIFSEGFGTYEKVAEAEYALKQSTGFHELVNPNFPAKPIKMEVEAFQADGVTPVQYDTIIINWSKADGNFQMGVKHDGELIIYLPVEGNATNQQNDIVATLNKFIVTEFGIGTDIVLT